MMAVLLGGPSTGSTHTGHDALYAYPKDMETNGTPASVAGADTGLPRINLADAATQRVKWVWAIPVGWKALAFRWASIPAASGNVVWQFAYRLITLGETSVDGAVDSTIAIGALAGGTTAGWTYNTPASAAAIATPVGGLGDAPFMLCSLSRLGADGSDTVAGDVGVGVVTATRVDQ